MLLGDYLGTCTTGPGQACPITTPHPQGLNESMAMFILIHRGMVSLSQEKTEQLPSEITISDNGNCPKDQFTGMNVIMMELAEAEKPESSVCGDHSEEMSPAAQGLVLVSGTEVRSVLREDRVKTDKGKFKSCFKNIKRASKGKQSIKKNVPKGQRRSRHNR